MSTKKIKEPPAKKQVAKKPPTTREKLNAVGLDAICEMIIGGSLHREICRVIDVPISSFCEWIASDESIKNRIEEARKVSAQTSDEAAERVLKDAADPFELAKARELASHYRWRASRFNKGLYGEKLEVSGDDAAPLQVVIRKLSDG